MSLKHNLNFYKMIWYGSHFDQVVASTWLRLYVWYMYHTSLALWIQASCDTRSRKFWSSRQCEPSAAREFFLSLIFLYLVFVVGCLLWMMSGWLLRVHGLMCHQKRHLYVMILKQYVEVHVYLNHFIIMWHTKNMLLELIQTPLCLFETFDLYLEIGIGLIQGVKWFFFRGWRWTDLNSCILCSWRWRSMSWLLWP